MARWQHKAVISHSHVKDLNICFWLPPPPKKNNIEHNADHEQYKEDEHIWGKIFYLLFAGSLSGNFLQICDAFYPIALCSEI